MQITDQQLKEWINQLTPNLFEKTKKTDIVIKRQMCWMVILNLTTMSANRIAKVFDMNHSTIIIARQEHGHRPFSGIKSDEQYREEYFNLKYDFELFFNKSILSPKNGYWELTPNEGIYPQVIVH